ncbi:hypothetical protein ILP97_24255 [Amycolatopsis sp. H6(2020)]|nr:hypothetical protein [Amycolatopsis sp. H6(2020)]
MTTWPLFALIAGLATGVLIGCRLHSRAVTIKIARTLEKAEAAEYGIRLLVWHTGKSRDQLSCEYRYQRHGHLPAVPSRESSGPGDPQQVTRPTG